MSLSLSEFGTVALQRLLQRTPVRPRGAVAQPGFASSLSEAEAPPAGSTPEVPRSQMSATLTAFMSDFDTKGPQRVSGDVATQNPTAVTPSDATEGIDAGQESATAVAPSPRSAVNTEATQGDLQATDMDRIWALLLGQGSESAGVAAPATSTGRGALI